MKGTVLIKFKVKNGKLVPLDKLMGFRLKQFLESIEANDVISAIFESDEPNKTNAQLAKVHVMIKEISDYTGERIEKTKLDIKEQCGMTYYKNEKKMYKSFADCSKEDLSKVIEQIYIIGDFLNINFRKDLSD